MAGSLVPSEVEKLSVAERILLVEQIWDGIAEERDAVDVTQAQHEALDQRLQAHREAPEKGTPWEEVNATFEGEP